MAKAVEGLADALGRVEAYLESHTDRFEEQLKDLIRIPSISAQPAHAADTRRAAEFIRDDLAAMGMEAELIETKGHPIVRAKGSAGPDRPTLLVYGHYDVQPPEPLEPWLSPPFEPTVRDGNLYARGATDDKGQMFTHLKSAEAWLKAGGGLPVNVIYLIEGEEEVGSAGLSLHVKEHAAELRCDAVVISDSSQFAPGLPTICYGLKGLAYFDLRVQGPVKDLHSGYFGGAVANPANALVEMLARLKGPDGRVLVPGFYDSVRPLEGWERAEFARLPFSEKAYRESLGVTSLEGEAGYTTLERRWARPTCDVNGIFGGYSGPGPKTVLPSWAGAKLSFRLVPDQTPDAVAVQLRAYLETICPPGVTWELTAHHGALPVLIEVEHSPRISAAARAVEAGFGTRPVFTREGGSSPIVGVFQQYLGVDTLLLGWGLEDDNLHGPNEKFKLADFHRGIKASAHLLAELASL